MSLGIAGCDKPSQPAEQANRADAAATSDAATSDEVPSSGDAVPAPTKKAGPDRSHKGAAAPDTGFVAPDGKPVTLAAFRGKPVLLNLWATWCAPCIKEMPTLDALAARSGETLTVLTVSQDIDSSPDKIAAFFAKRGYRQLKPYLDPEVKLTTHYRANLPTTILYDAQGREVWRVAGEMDWTGKEAAALLAEAR